MGDHQPGAGIAHHMVEDAAAISGVDRHIDGAGIVDGEPGHEAIEAVRQPDEDVVTLRHAEALERAGHGADAGEGPDR